MRVRYRKQTKRIRAAEMRSTQRGFLQPIPQTEHQVCVVVGEEVYMKEAVTQQRLRGTQITWGSIRSYTEVLSVRFYLLVGCYLLFTETYRMRKQTCCLPSNYSLCILNKIMIVFEAAVLKKNTHTHTQTFFDSGFRCVSEEFSCYIFSLHCR